MSDTFGPQDIATWTKPAPASGGGSQTFGPEDIQAWGFDGRDYGGIMAPVKRFRQDVTKNLDTAADMAMGLGHQVWAAAAESGMRLLGAAHGEDRRITNRAAAELRDDILAKSPTFFTDMTKRLTGDTSPSALQRVMDSFMEGVAKGGEKVEEKSGGKVSTDDVGYTVNSLFAILGGAGAKASARRIGRQPMPEDNLLQPAKRPSEDVPLETKATVATAALGAGAMLQEEYPEAGELAGAAGAMFLAGRGKGLGVKELAKLSNFAPLGSIIDQSSYTLNTLNRLPQNRFEFKKQTVEDLLRQQDVTQAERDAIKASLDAVKGDTISAKDLMLGVKLATQDFELGRKATDEFASYGLDSIGRNAEQIGLPDPITDESIARAERELPEIIRRAEAPDGTTFNGFPGTAERARELRVQMEEELANFRAVSAIKPVSAPETTIYQLPFEVSSANHFSDPRYFAHTRSFVEDGVRHVVELQSDLAQKVGRVFTPEEMAKMQTELDELAPSRKALQQIGYASSRAGQYNPIEALEKFKANRDALLKYNPYAEMQLEAQILDGLPIDARRQFTEMKFAKIADLTESERFKYPGSSQGMVGIRRMYEMGAIDLSDGVVDWLLTEKRGDIETRGLYEGQVRYQIQRWAEQKLNQAQARQAELLSKMQEAHSAQQVAPMLKNWHKRLVREELARPGKEAQELLDLAETYRKSLVESKAEGFRSTEADRTATWMTSQQRLQNAQGWTDSWRDQEARIAELEEKAAATRGQGVVRFATADTVAKVEGWPERPATGETTVPELRGRTFTFPETGEQAILTGRITSTMQDGRPFDGTLEYRDPTTGTNHVTNFEFFPKEIQKEVLDRFGSRFSPEHQGIYDRYKKDVEKFLTQLGGKPYTDAKGHTWIEVPTTPKGTRTGAPPQMFGGADQKLLMTLAGAGLGAVASAWMSKDPTVFGTAVGALLGAGIARSGKNLSAGLDAAAGLLSTRIRNISPAVHHAAVKHAGEVMRETHRRITNVDPFLTGLNKLPRKQRDAINDALLDNDYARVDAALPQALRPAWSAVKAELAVAGVDLRAAGLLKTLRQDYFPRVVKDREGLLEALGVADRTRLQQAIAAAQNAKGGPLSPFEESTIINQVLLKKEPTGTGRGFLRQRQIGLASQYKKFYYTPTESLHSYLGAVSRAIARDRFFGKDLARSQTGAVNIDASIGNVVRRELRGGNLSFEEGQKLGELLRVYFVESDKPATGFGQVGLYAKDIATGALLANPVSAAVQLGDIAMSVYQSGIKPTLTSLVSPRKITMKEMGLADHISEEFVGDRFTAKVLNKALKASGFSAIDALGKNVNLNSTVRKYQTLARTTSGRGRIARELQAAWGDDFAPLMQELQSRQVGPMTQALAFEKLSDVQPVSKLEVPEAYLARPNWRLLYTLKTFMLKQLDLVRRDAWNEIKKGNVAKGTANLTRLGLALGVSGATTSWIQNYILGRETDFESADIPLNALKAWGLSLYTIDKIKQGKPVEALGSLPIPPYQVFDEIVRQDPKAVRYIPLAGKIYYEREMGGAEKADKAKRKRERRDMTPEEREFMRELDALGAGR